MAHFKDPLLWLYSLFAAVIGAAAGAVPLVIVDPEHFNPRNGSTDLLVMMCVMGAIAAGNYLKQHPLPELEEETPE